MCYARMLYETVDMLNLYKITGCFFSMFCLNHTKPLLLICALCLEKLPLPLSFVQNVEKNV